MAHIELCSVSKIYSMGSISVKAVDGVSLSFEKGDFAAISGPSGSGKSTLLNIIGLVDVPSSGKVILDGIDVYSKIDLSSRISARLDSKLTSIRRQKIGFIFQTFNLIPVLSVRENVSFPLKLGQSNMNRKEEKEWVDFLLEKVGLTDRASHKPHELSGGQRQRVAIARALSTNASIVLADEPTANLDSKNGEQILALMKKLNEEIGTTFVFSTHDAKIVSMSNRVVHISDGKIQGKMQ